MKGLLYTITLNEPVLANSLGGEPNSADSLFYLPGGLLRGALINAYGGTKDAADDEFSRLFLNGKTRYLNAYPVYDGKRALPIPVRYKAPKNMAVSSLGFLEGTEIKALEESWQVNVHTQRDAERGRSTEDEGAIFRYIALPAGMVLKGAILADENGDIAKIQDLLKSQSLQLGKARSAGYGSVTIEISKMDDDWREAEAPALKASQEITIALLSPALVRDENGQFGANAKEAFAAHLEGKLDIKTEAKTELVGGFNRKWGLPLPQQVAISAGSIFTITTEKEVPVEALQELEAKGIGERRAEGFGRVAINISLPEAKEIEDDNWKAIELNLPAQANSQAKDLAENDRLAQQMLTRLLRRDLDQAVITVARIAVSAYRKDAVPNSQLSRWRTIIGNALGEENKEQAVERIKSFQVNAEGKSGWKKMQKARIQITERTIRLTAWIERLLAEEDTLLTALDKNFKTSIKLGENNQIQVDKKLNAEYRLRLLEAVLGMMAKVNSKGGLNG